MEKLALLGGAPAVSAPGPHYIWPVITRETEEAVLRQLHEAVAIYDGSGIFGRFEARWSDYHSRRHSLLTSSGTVGLLSMFVGADLQPGDEVIAPAYTFYATCTPLFTIGVVPVLCDCDETGNVDPQALEALISQRTKAVVITDMWGVPCRLDAISEICKKHGLLLLEDCSHAHGALYQGRKVGSFWSDAAVWSLGGQKIITGGEGGILSTDDDRIHARALLLGHYNKRCLKEISPADPLYRFGLTGMGLKFRASPMNVALIEQQFPNLDAWVSQKRQFAAMLSRELKAVPGLRVPSVPAGAEPSWYAYVLRYRSDELSGLPIEKFHDALLAEGLTESNRPTSTCPLNWLPLFQEPWSVFPGYPAGKPIALPGQFPQAEGFAAQAITLPVWARPEDEPLVKQYIAGICKVVANHKQLL